MHLTPLINIELTRSRDGATTLECFGATYAINSMAKYGLTKNLVKLASYVKPEASSPAKVLGILPA